MESRDPPAFIASTFRRFLNCGVLAKGFVRVRSSLCRQELLVAFSCKDRSFCPSCTARRAAETADHLVDAVLPQAPYMAPEDACTTWRALWAALAKLDDELMAHVHLENNVLFPRALRG